MWDAEHFGEVVGEAVAKVQTVGVQIAAEEPCSRRGEQGQLYRVQSSRSMTYPVFDKEAPTTLVMPILDGSGNADSSLSYAGS